MKLLLSYIDDFWHQLTDTKTKKNLVWKKIGQRMNEAGYDITRIQCEGRWKTLKAAYKRCIDYNNETGNACGLEVLTVLKLTEMFT